MALNLILLHQFYHELSYEEYIMTDETTKILTDQDVSMLLEIANLACHKGFPANAREIVQGVLAERPNFVPAQISLAYSHIVVDDFQTALDMLEGILDKHPDDDDARVMQVLALVLAGRSDEAKKSIADFGHDCSQKQLAWDIVNNM